MEQSAVYEGYTNQATTADIDLWREDGNYPWMVKISSLVCPSDPIKINTGEIGGSNYYANRGDLYVQFDFPGGNPPGSPQRDHRGRGPFTRFGENFSYTSDGLSNTLLLMEVSNGSGGSNVPRQGFVLSGASSQLTRNYNMNPNACYNLKQGNVLNTDAANLAGNSYAGGAGSEPNSLPGLRWHDGRSLFSQCFAILPPNSPRCATNGADYRTYNLVSAGSYHTGGCNVSLGDGSGKFVSETVDWGTTGVSAKDAGLTNGAESYRYKGKSIYGVWGSMGSAWGGESASL